MTITKAYEDMERMIDKGSDSKIKYLLSVINMMMAQYCEALKEEIYYATRTHWTLKHERDRRLRK